jgi:L-ascorbate metabolism protein UlaG (beta-lactamase superfamily)
LTDPNFCTGRPGLTWARGSVLKRRTEPALQVDELPPLDAVVLSHLHDDHFDRIARDGLPKTTPISHHGGRGPHAAAVGLLAGVALTTWQTHELRSPAGDVLGTRPPPGRTPADRCRRCCRP